MSRRPPSILAIAASVIAMLIIGLVLWSGKPQSTPRVAKMTRVVEQPLGWPIADHILTFRSRYQQDLQLDHLPDWNLFTREYFLSLAARREAIKVWALDSPSKPEILFMGQMHVNLAGGNTPESQRRVEQFQTALFERLKLKAGGVSTIVIEQSGTDEVLTPEVFLKISRRAFHDLGVDVPDEAILKMMHEDRQAATRAIIELSTPVICGEEWPNRMQSALMMRPANPTDEKRRTATEHFVQAFSALRSEIILIRTLEYLRKTDTIKAIIIQGEWHRADIERLVPEYHIALTTEFPE